MLTFIVVHLHHLHMTPFLCQTSAASMCSYARMRMPISPSKPSVVSTSGWMMTPTEMWMWLKQMGWVEAKKCSHQQWFERNAFSIDVSQTYLFMKPLCGISFVVTTKGDLMLWGFGVFDVYILIVTPWTHLLGGVFLLIPLLKVLKIGALKNIFMRTHACIPLPQSTVHASIECSGMFKVLGPCWFQF